MNIALLMLIAGTMMLATTSVFIGRVVTLMLLLMVLTYKSTFIALFSCDIENLVFFRALQAADFVFASTVAMLVLAISPATRASLFRRGSGTSRSMLLVALLLAYGLLLGLLLNPLDHVAMYLRLLSYPVLLYVIGSWLAQGMDLRQMALCGIVVLLPAALLIYVEFLFRAQYHDAISSSCYHSLKFGRSSGWYRLEDMLLFSKMRLFNVDLFADIHFVKPLGITLNYPSTSYLMLFGLLCAWLRKHVFMAMLFFGALALMTTKASLFMLLSLLAVPLLAQQFSARRLNVVLWAWLLGYGVMATTWLMVAGSNIHAYSLLASLASVASFPQGNGIGWGGALTAGAAARTWDTNMLAGDSGLAILINMLGVAGLVVFWLYARIFVQAARRNPASVLPREQLLVAAFGIGVMGNAILQELAVGPYAVGLALLALVIAQQRRAAP